MGGEEGDGNVCERAFTRHTVEGCIHALNNPFHRCTARCEAVVLKKRAMYCVGGSVSAAKPDETKCYDVQQMRNDDSNESDIVKDGSEDDEQDIQEKLIVVVPNADPIARESCSCSGPIIESNNKRSEKKSDQCSGVIDFQYLQKLDIPVILTDALDEWTLSEDRSTEFNIFDEYRRCASASTSAECSSLTLYDQFPRPNAAIRVPILDYMSYVQQYDRYYQKSDANILTSNRLSAHEKRLGTPLVLPDWSCDDAINRQVLRKKTTSFLPNFLQDFELKNKLSSRHSSNSSSQSAVVHSLSKTSIDLLACGTVIGLRKVTNTAIENECNNANGDSQAESGMRSDANVVTWHAVYHGARQIILYSPKDTHAIGGDVIMEGISAHDPFLNAVSLVETSSGNNNDRNSSNTSLGEGNAAARAARAHVAVLKAGETILIPRGWWWTVRAISKGAALTGHIRLNDSCVNADTKYKSVVKDDVSILSDRKLSISDRASAAKRIGNEQFTRGRYSLALEAYTRAITLLSGVESGEGTGTGSMSEQDEQLLATVLCNRAAVNLRLKHWLDVISDCTAALRCSHSVAHFQSKTTSKLYYRRAKALEMIGDADGAVNDMKKVLELEPHNTDARHAMQEYSSILNRISIIARGNDDIKRKQVKGLYTGVPQSYCT